MAPSLTVVTVDEVPIVGVDDFHAVSRVNITAVVWPREPRLVGAGAILVVEVGDRFAVRDGEVEDVDILAGVAVHGVSREVRIDVVAQEALKICIGSDEGDVRGSKGYFVPGLFASPFQSGPGEGLHIRKTKPSFDHRELLVTNIMCVAAKEEHDRDGHEDLEVDEGGDVGEDEGALIIAGIIQLKV